MSLDVILGPMFAGKSSRILSVVSRYASLGLSVLVIKHERDTRYSEDDELVAHDQRRTPCLRVASLNAVSDDIISRHRVILVDEAQFFPGLVAFVKRVVEQHRRHLYLIGLDGDFQRKPFGELLDCIPLADRVERLTAFCHRCANGKPGLFTHRRQGPSDQQVVVGGSGMYESLCRTCYLEVVQGPI